MGLAVTFIKTSNPTLCQQKEFVYSLKIAHKQCSLIDPFPTKPITTRLFSRAATFPALSILTIFLDKCQMISFKDIKSTTFLFEKRLFWKRLLFENKYMFKKKN